MANLGQRFGLWLARWAGWSEQVLLAAHQARIEALQGDILTLQTERTGYRDQIVAHLKNVAGLDQYIRDLQHRLDGRGNEIATLQGLLSSSTGLLVSEPVLSKAREFIQDADTTFIGGETKRHAVYARLIKEFPTTPKRELGLAIELALFQPVKEG